MDHEKKSIHFWEEGLKKNLSQIYTFWRGPLAILTIYNQIFFSRGPSALIFRDLSFLICFNGICQKKSAFLHEIWSDFSYDHFFRRKNVKIIQKSMFYKSPEILVPCDER